MDLPKGIEEIISKLMSLDPKYDNLDYNRTVRKFARKGIIYVGIKKCICYCPFCKAEGKRHIFKNRKSYYSHVKICEKCKEYIAFIEKMNKNMLEHVANFCSCNQVSLNAICSQNFGKILITANPLLRCIKRENLRKQIYELFDNKRAEINKDSIGEFCSILIDGAKRNLKNFYGFVIFSKSRLFYFQISNLKIAISENISKITRNIINYLNNVLEVEVIAVCTDHAPNMRRAFNPSDSISCQFITDFYFEWIGCFCHLLNLGISDLEENPYFQKVKNALLFILNFCSKMEIPQKVPTFCKTRWDSLSKSFDFILFHIDRIKLRLSSSLNDLLIKRGMLETDILFKKETNDLKERLAKVKKEITSHENSIEILTSKEFDETVTLFNYMSNLINKIGADNFLLCQVYPEIIQLFDFFSTFLTEKVQTFAHIITDRILSADEYTQAIVAYFFTIEGHNFILNNVKEKDEIIMKIKEYLIYYNGMKFESIFNDKFLLTQFEIFLNMKDFNTSDSFEFWNLLRKDPNMNLLAEIAIRFLNMPCSEAAVERLFSHLKYLFGKKNYNMSDKLLNAELGIRMENVYSKQNE